jgi:hypothetical protein
VEREDDSGAPADRCGGARCTATSNAADRLDDAGRVILDIAVATA